MRKKNRDRFRRNDTNEDRAKSRYDYTRSIKEETARDSDASRDIIHKNNRVTRNPIAKIKRIGGLFTVLDYKRVGVVIAIIVLIVLVFAVVIPTSVEAQYIQAYQVYINGNSIGITQDMMMLDEILNTMYADYEAYYGMSISNDYDVTYEIVKVKEQFIYPTQYYDAIFRNNLSVGVMAWVIYVNNSPAVVLETREEAEWVLGQLLMPYKLDAEVKGRTDIGFLENVEIKNTSMDYRNILDQEVALNILRYGGDIKIKKHTVVSGETLYSIAKRYDLRISDLKKANPFLLEKDKIYRNDVLIIAEINNVVNIKYTEYVERQEALAYGTLIITDDTMYETQTRVQQTGIEGVRNITGNAIYINGSESDITILTEEKISEPTQEILVKGTKAVPNILILAKGGDMPFPLANYTITSPFGTRNTGIEGASTFHNGIDLAASYGTPIYASADGQVRFAGSNGGYGLMVKLTHDGGVETRYGHCSQLLVRNNQYVKRGEIIALVGSTGTSSGNHVHFEVRINGKPVNPQ